jgi:hypothetical protein
VCVLASTLKSAPRPQVQLQSRRPINIELAVMRREQMGFEVFIRWTMSRFVFAFRFSDRTKRIQNQTRNFSTDKFKRRYSEAVYLFI